MVAGWFHTCAVQTDGLTVCWGKDVEGESSPPSGIQHSRLVSGGDFHTVALDSDGLLSVWGAPSIVKDIQLSERFVQLAGGGDFVCGVTEGRRIRCAGADYEDQPFPTPPSGLFAKVAVGGGHGGGYACALDLQGRVHCWGNNKQGQLDVPWESFGDR